MLRTEVNESPQHLTSDRMEINEWFCPLKERAVEDIMQDVRTPQGSFIINESKANEFTITIKCKRNISQVMLLCIPSKRLFSFDSDDALVFTSLAELFTNLMLSRIKIVSPDHKDLVFKDYISSPIKTFVGFIADKSGQEAIELLNQSPLLSCYGIWYSKPYEYVIGIKTGAKVVTCPIQQTKRGFSLDARMYFNEIEQLLVYYSTNLLPMTNKEKIGKLPIPIEYTAFHASQIENRIKEMSKFCPGIEPGKDGFIHEFMNLESESKRLNLSYRSARAQENINKNRYKNILACDQTRVVLTQSTGDYINANYVTLNEKDGGLNYILSQAPTNTTYPDHWAMVMEYGVKLIIVLTKVEEKGVKKCHKYWPTAKNPMLEMANFVIKLEEENSVRDIVFRKFSIFSKVTNTSHDVQMMHFQAWPDFGVPKDSWGIIELLSISSKCRNKHSDVPMLVHCSAGIGRTGAFVVLDSILHQIKMNGLSTVINVKDTALRLRSQRSLTVSTLDQYKFIYYTLSTYVEWKMGPANFKLRP